jgi:hypothetical protein
MSSDEISKLLKKEKDILTPNEYEYVRLEAMFYTLIDTLIEQSIIDIDLFNNNLYDNLSILNKMIETSKVESIKTKVATALFVKSVGNA